MKSLFTSFTLLTAVTLLAGGNQLGNPGFEKINGERQPLFWERECNIILSHPLIISSDSHSGENAVCLITDEWNYLRPQFIKQKKSIPAGTKDCTLSAYCKGQGLVQLELEFHESPSVEKPSGDKMSTATATRVSSKNDVAVRKIFGLTEKYSQYELSVPVPPKADSVVVKLGNSVDDLNRLNVWGKVFIDDVTLTFENIANEKPPVQEELMNVAPYSLIYLEPAAFNIHKLIDDDVTTTYSNMMGLERAGCAYLVFSEPVPVELIQLYLNGNVNSFLIQGDEKGDGRYDKEIVRIKGESACGWVSRTIKPTLLKAIKIQALEGEHLYTEYRGTMPIFNELKVWAKIDRDSLNKLKNGMVFKKEQPLEKGVKSINYIPPYSFSLPRRIGGQFKKRICADLWLWGIDASKPDSVINDYKNTPKFQEVVRNLKEMNANSVMIDLTESSVWNLMPWPSAVANGTRNNILKAAVTAIKSEGFEVLAELIHNIKPFETEKWHYPGEETSRYPSMKQYPSIVHGDHFKSNWFKILDEMMACGLDGVGLSTDEHQYKGHFMRTFPVDDPARALFKSKFGYDLPEQEEDSMRFRQWIEMRHEGICNVFNDVALKLKRKYPKAVLSTMWMSPESACSNVTEICIPWDMMAGRGLITEMGSDYTGPWGIRMGSAVNGWRGGHMVYSGNACGSRNPDNYYYGTVLWSWMLGANGANYWRYNWIVDLGSVHALKNAFAMSDDLEALGAWDAKPPARVALLSSRRSLDWWQIKAWWGDHKDPNWDRGLEGQRGWYADRVSFEMLYKSGIPFDWLFLEREDHLARLSEYKVIIMPFAYSVSSDALKLISEAVSKGSVLILLDGQEGVVDAVGEPWPSPAFKTLSASTRVIIVNDDIIKYGGTDYYADKVIRLVKTHLKTEPVFQFNRYGHDIDAALLQKNEGEYFVFVVNWEKEKQSVDLRLNIPDGNYEILMRDPYQWYRFPRLMPNNELKKFRMLVDPERPFFLYIQRKSLKGGRS
ncbi:MAG: hypothetical protein WCI51_11470 [Lentisphaerota bacterium]